MNYKLAKQLKDTGFPQPKSKQDNLIVGSINKLIENGKVFLGGKGGWVYIPTLSELIEACGDGNFTLSKMKTGWYAHKGLVMRGGIETWRKTPEEAVSKLWLELNK